MRDLDRRNLERYVTTTAPGAGGLIEVEGDFLSRALSHLQQTGAAAGLNEGRPIEFVPDPRVQTASSGAASVHAQQYHQGIPMFQADSTVLFAPGGALEQSVGSTVEVGDASAELSTIEAIAAVAAGLDFLNLPENRTEEPDPFGQTPEPFPVLGPAPDEVIVAFPDLPSRPTTLVPGPFAGRGIGLHLVWLPLGAVLRLGWLMELQLPEPRGSVLLIVDAQDASVLFASATTHGLLASGTVFPLRGDGPRTEFPWPRPLTDYPVRSATALPAAFPDPWVAGEQTSGNAVTAVDAETGTCVTGVRAGGSVTFDAPDEARRRVINAFYYCCYLHDLYYLLGFREIDGNFQADALGRGGAAADSALVTVYPDIVSATANMTTPKDGSRPRLNVGLVTASGRHTALDATVVYHEFTHGLTNRLIGGPANSVSLLAPQSAGMGEGWSDYFACSIAGTQVIAAWVTDKPSGIRRHPYDSSFPGTFADVGTPTYRKAHQLGEIWCATLLEFERRVTAPLALQVVVDSLKLAPANPSFLDGRDAMLRALDGMLAAGQLAPAAHRAAVDSFWTTFARFGMGPAATTQGPQLAGVVADFASPTAPVVDPTATARPGSAIPDKDARGVTSRITMAVDGRVERVSISVDISHEFRGDLRVTLTSPLGVSVVLRTPDDDARRDLVTTFDLATTPALAGLRGQPVRGVWTLNVADLQRLSLGVFRAWTLTVKTQ
ncbi:M36 family metallopeptidase [Cryptosporangium aurantiacum]|uniref:Extracellular elastinolytic metalloproteinase n=1 Tax=Cryptosporangium aurantiacum TaxID=134849 RepID=A0A1M7RGR1_9ACTN|nr:M36 family metallopeptidase [Cryptosporangium aurantiacum]SHN45396.1 extracellular elastinolytic metalloproteinase [Cryptosporangium aurantiacum]